MSTYCERCNREWPGHHSECPGCTVRNKSRNRIERFALNALGAGTLVVWDVMTAVGLCVIAHILASALNLSPLGLTVAIVTLYALRGTKK